MTTSAPKRTRRTKAARREEELQLARAAQRGLLPPLHLEIPGFEFAMRNLTCEDLGGDFCDYFTLEDSSIGLYIGDVQGKGIGAALYALLISGVIRGMHKSGQTPSDVISLLNRRVAFRGLPSRFSCVGYAVLRLENRTLTFSNAGIPFPFLLRRGDVSPVELTGHPVGLFGSGQYEQISLTLQPEDVLMFHSDGVADSLASSRNGRADGEEKLRKLLKGLAGKNLRDIAEALQRKLQYSGKRRRTLLDDATFVLVRVL